jgi:hypothetical protein
LTGATLIRSNIAGLANTHTRMFSAPIKFQISACTGPTSQFTPRAQKTVFVTPTDCEKWSNRVFTLYTHTAPLRAFRLLYACKACCSLYMLYYVRAHVCPARLKPKAVWECIDGSDSLIELLTVVCSALKERAPPKYYHFSRTWSQNVSHASLQIALHRRGWKIVATLQFHPTIYQSECLLVCSLWLVDVVVATGRVALKECNTVHGLIYYIDSLIPICMCFVCRNNIILLFKHAKYCGIHHNVVLLSS